MSETLKHVQDLVGVQEIIISEHGYDELASDQILVQDVIDGVGEASIIPSITKDLVYWFCSGTANANPYM